MGFSRIEKFTQSQIGQENYNKWNAEKLLHLHTIFWCRVPSSRSRNTELNNSILVWILTTRIKIYIYGQETPFCFKFLLFRYKILSYNFSRIISDEFQFQSSNSPKLTHLNAPYFLFSCFDLKQYFCISLDFCPKIT